MTAIQRYDISAIVVIPHLEWSQDDDEKFEAAIRTAKKMREM